MKVFLRQDWFGPRGRYYPRGHHEMAEDMRKLLPSTAKVDEPIVTDEAPAAPSLIEGDAERAAADELQRVAEKAEADRVKAAEAFKAQMVAEAARKKKAGA